MSFHGTGIYYTECLRKIKQNNYYFGDKFGLISSTFNFTKKNMSFFIWFQVFNCPVFFFCEKIVRVFIY